MSKQYQPYSPRQGFLLPPSPIDWLPEDHLAYFILDLVDQLDISAIEDRIQVKDSRGTRPYAPRMMLSLLLYGYCTGVFSSRRIARGTYEDVAFRVLAGGNHPHFTSINAFRKQFLDEIAGLFAQVLAMCVKAGLVKLGHVALDGTKLQANASKHKAMSYERMVELEARLRAEIDELMARAEQADTDEDALYGPNGQAQDIPAELSRREKRLVRLQQAKAELEQEARLARALQLRDLAARNDERAKDESQRTRDRKAATTRAAQQRAQADELDPPDDDDQPPSSFVNDEGLELHRVPANLDGTPKPKAQRNFTDPDSRIVTSSGELFVQGYNGQAVVDDAHQVIVAQSLTNRSPDAGNLAAMLALAVANLEGCPKRISADSGYWNATVVDDAAVVSNGTTLYIATERHKHWDHYHRVTEGPAPDHLDARDQMRWKLRTPDGRAVYARRKVIVEPVFGQIKEARGFRRFSLRGLRQAAGEWSLVCLTHNLLKLFRAGGLSLAAA